MSGQMENCPKILLFTRILAYLSNATLLDTALIAHGRSIFEQHLQLASLIIRCGSITVSRRRKASLRPDS
jgi:acyl-CoA thioesterase